MYVLKFAFKKHGKRFIFDPDGYYSYDTIEVGDFVSIGYGAVLIAPKSGIEIGNKVLLGTNVTIRGGNHTINRVGKYIYDVSDLEKNPEDDKKVIIEDDVWVGANVTILKGVKIGRGSVIGAGAVVSRDIPPYAIALGVPARVKKFRFENVEVILEHEKNLYPVHARLSKEEISELFKEFLP